MPAHILRSLWREEMAWRQGGVCYYCAHPFIYEEEGARATLDHIKPVALGGQDTEANYCAACRQCNLDKGALPIGLFTRLRVGYAGRGLPEKARATLDGLPTATRRRRAALILRCEFFSK